MNSRRSHLRCAAGFGLAAFLLFPTVGARASDSDEHEFHRHHVGVFLGAASRPENEHHHSDEHGFAGGVEYEYRFAKAAGVGVIAEAATGDLPDVVVLGLIFIHPWKGLQIAAGAGAEISSGDSEFLTRLGAAYQFKVGERFTIAPNFNADLVNGDPTYVYGLTFGVGF